MQYILPALLVFLVGIIGLVILNFSLLRLSSESVKIVIDGDASPENLEGLVIAAKDVAERYLIGAQIYIEGGSEFQVDLLCKRYDVQKI